MQTMKMVNLDHVFPSKTNFRKTFDKKQMEELTESIKEKGVVQPILIRPTAEHKAEGIFEIVSGERRYRAAMAAGLKDIPAMIRDLNDRDAMEIQIIENLHRADVHPLEEAEGYEILMKQQGCYINIDDLAVKVGKSKTYIYGRMKLCELVPEVKKSFYSGEISASIALLLSRVPQSLQKEAVKEILNHWDGPMSYKDAKGYLEEDFTVNLEHAPFDTKDATLCLNVGPCTTCPKRSGSAPQLFPDIKRKDVCTDITCFRAKRDAANKIKIEDAEKTGAKVYTGDSAKRIFESEYSSRAAFINLDKDCYDVGKTEKYSKLVGPVKDLADHKVLAITEDGKVGEFYPRQVVYEAMKVRGHKINTHAVTSNAESLLKGKINYAAAHLAITAIMDHTKNKSKLTLELLIDLIKRSAHTEAVWQYCKRTDPSIKITDCHKSIDKIIENMPVAEAVYFAIEILLCDYCVSYDGVSDSIKRSCKLFGLNVKDFEKKAAESFNKVNKPKKIVSKVKK